MIDKEIAASTILAYRKGDPISDADLNTTITYLDPVVEALAAFGERFHLAWKELYFTLDSLKGFQRNRKEH